MKKFIIQDSNPFLGPSFTPLNRILRQCWNIVYVLVFRFSPRPLHAWRAAILRLFGARLGHGCHVYPSAKIWAPWNLTLGHHVGIADGATLYNMDTIQIGDFAVISQGAHLCGGTHDYNSENFQLIARPIIIGAYAWICAEAFIHPGVVIPEGAVVGARAVATRSLPHEWAVYAGHPCQEVRKRTRNVTLNSSSAQVSP